jgi:hypothetical protein
LHGLDFFWVNQILPNPKVFNEKRSRNSGQAPARERWRPPVFAIEADEICESSFYNMTVLVAKDDVVIPASLSFT